MVVVKRNGETLKKGKSTMSYDKQTAEFIATVVQNIPKMSGDVMQGWIGNPKALQKLLLGLCPSVNEPKEVSLLRKLASVQVEGVARFVVDDDTLQAANIGWTGDNFKKFFAKKVEEDVPACAIAVHRLERASSDAPILTELGDRAEISLAHLFELIKKQSKGETGQLLVNGYANVAYVRGTDGNLWAVLAAWRSYCGCWGVEADSVEDPDGWRGSRRILSRDS